MRRMRRRMIRMRLLLLTLLLDFQCPDRRTFCPIVRATHYLLEKNRNGMLKCRDFVVLILFF